MKNFRSSIGMLLLVLFITACSTSKYTADAKQEWKAGYKIQAGINHGGIAENDDMTLIEGTMIPGIDAYSGATTKGANVGAHILLPTRKNSFETGLDYMFNNQTFTYTSEASNFSGDRNIITSQFLFPVSYNIGFFRDSKGEARSNFRIGYVFQVNLFNVSDEDLALPPYSTDAFSKGITLGFDIIPLSFDNGAKLGLFMDVYRGSQIYEDVFNQREFLTPGSSYIKAGLIYYLKD